MKKLSSPGTPPDWMHLVAFVAVLVTGVLLVVLGHLTATEVTSACAAIGGLYGAWRIASSRQ
jgi:hypothetical protein